MAIYAIGDLQGCLDDLKALLDKIDFREDRDKLWFVGDLVNRGPRSLESLRFVKALGSRAQTVLGNHDLNLLAVAYAGRKPKRKDTLDDILAAPDREELLTWLRHQPLLVHSRKHDFTMVHAGLPPQWTLSEAKQRAREVEAVLQGKDYAHFLKAMYGDRPECWSESLTGLERLRFITNCFTRLRYCTADGRLDLEAKSPPGQQHPGLLPWFDVPGRRTAQEAIVFGHWSTLGEVDTPNVYGIDTGCVWGGTLSALRIGKQGLRMIRVPCAGAQHPGQEEGP